MMKKTIEDLLARLEDALNQHIEELDADSNDTDEYDSILTDIEMANAVVQDLKQ